MLTTLFLTPGMLLPCLRRNFVVLRHPILHVDDVLLAGTAEFVNSTTEMIKKRFNMSKISDNSFRFCGLDINLNQDGSITVSMEDYADSISPMNADKKGRKRSDEVSYQETSELRELTGKIAWLSQNTRPDLSYGAIHLQKRVNSATFEEILPRARQPKCGSLGKLALSLFLMLLT